MRFRIGPVPDSPDFHPEEADWAKLREPTFGRMTLLAIPLSALLLVGLSLAWIGVASIRGMESDVTVIVSAGDLVVVPLALATVSLLHELIHAVSLPRAGMTSATTVGFWLQAFTPYVAHDGEMHRNRQLLVSVIPFLVLTIVPLFVGLILGSPPAWLVALSVLNGFGSSGDLIAAFLVASQVPRTARVRNKGHATWWRTPV